MILEIAGDVKNGTDRGLISLRFHNTIANAIVEIACLVREKTGIERVALSGGCFQNAMLLKKALGELATMGFHTFTNESIPCNDACLSLGQAYILRHANL
jgi:hydrogenase maturation protein HypF